MDTLKKNSPIQRIHDEGYQAIINADTMKIIGKCKPDDVPGKIAELEKQFSDVGQDADGDIICCEE